MTDLKKIVEILFTFTDKVTTPLKKTTKEVKAIGKESKDSSKQVNRLDKSLDSASKSSEKASKKTKKFGKEVQTTDKKLKDLSKSLKGLATKLKGPIAAFTALGGAITAAFIFPLKAFAEFEDKMAMVKAVSRATEEEFKELTETAQYLGRTTRYSATESADGLLLLVKAGMKANDAIAALPHTLRLAQAGALALGDAADMVTNIMSAYGFKATELQEVSDVLARTFTSTNSNLNELAQGFKYVGPIAKGLGADFEDLMAAIGLLHSAGLKAEMSGTILRNTLDALFNPTKDEAKMMGELSRRIGGAGLQIRNSDGNFVGFVSVIAQLEKAGLKAEEALRLFGMRAGPGIAALLQQGSDNLENLKISLDDSSGALEGISKIMKETLVNSFKSAMSAVSGLAIAFGAKLKPAAVTTLNAVAFAINKVTDALKLYNKVKQLPKEAAKLALLKHNLQTAGTSFTPEQLAAAKARFGEESKLVGIIKKRGELEFKYSKLLTSEYSEQAAGFNKLVIAKQTGLGIQKATGEISEDEYIKQSIALDVYKYEKRSQLATEYFDEVKLFYSKDSDEYKSAAAQQAKVAEQLSASKQVAIKKWADYHSQQLKKSLDKEKALLNEIEDINRQKANLEIETADKLFQIEQRGRGDEEKEAAQKERAYEKLASAQKALAIGDIGGAKRFASASEGLFYSLKNNVDAYEGVQAAARMTGAVLVTEGRQAQQALDLQREASEALRKSLDMVNESILQMTIQFQKAMKIDSSQAEDAFNRLQDSSKASRNDQHKTKKSMEELVDVVDQIPSGGFKIKADVKGLSEIEKLRKEIIKLQEEVDNLSNKTITIKTEQGKSTGGKIGKYAKGAKLPGYGGGDKRLSLLEDGEYVIRKEAVKKYGSSLFGLLNKMTLPKHAMGGQIGAVGQITTMPEGKTVNLNLNIGRDVFPAVTSPSTADALQKALGMEYLKTGGYRPSWEG